MISASRMNSRPVAGDVVRDGAGNRFVIVSVGMRYANAHVEANPKMTLLINLKEIYPADTMPVPPPPAPGGVSE